MSTLTLPFLFFIFNRVFKNKKIAYVLFALISFLPNMITYNNVLGTEILSVFLLSIVICLFVHMNAKNKKINLFLQGVVSGILSLVKPFFMAYPVVILWVIFVSKKDFKELGKKAIFLLTGFLLVLIPSVIKNYKQFGEFIPISYNGGFTLYINNNSQNYTGSWMNASKVNASDEFEQKLRDVGYELRVDAKTEKEQCLRNPKASGVFKDEAVKWIINNPVEFLQLGLLRIKNVFFSGANDIQLWSFEASTINNFTIEEYRMFKVFMGIADSLICTLGVAFIVLLIANIKNIFLEKTNINKLITMWTLIFFGAVYFVIEGQARYNFPTLFLLVMCIGFIAERLDVGVVQESTAKRRHK
jgi:4-amino-4-deoxy-L-arabinose transferase-like glycosyltransferase